VCLGVSRFRCLFLVESVGFVVVVFGVFVGVVVWGWVGVIGLSLCWTVVRKCCFSSLESFCIGLSQTFLWLI